MFVVVVQSKEGEVLRVLGRTPGGRLEAEAIEATTRCENGEMLSVHEVLEPTIFDVHGISGFTDLT